MMSPVLAANMSSPWVKSAVYALSLVWAKPRYFRSIEGGLGGSTTGTAAAIASGRAEAMGFSTTTGAWTAEKTSRPVPVYSICSLRLSSSMRRTGSSLDLETLRDGLVVRAAAMTGLTDGWALD